MHRPEVLQTSATCLSDKVLTHLGDEHRRRHVQRLPAQAKAGGQEGRPWRRPARAHGGKPSLRLSLESRASAASMVHELGMKLAADAVAAVPAGAARTELMARHLPWVRFLP